MLLSVAIMDVHIIKRAFFMMKIFAPQYYKHFKCIADKCKNNCCVDWEIDIDDATYKKYLGIGTEYGKQIIESIDVSGDFRCFRLNEGRCPHLNDAGLCEIISEYGDSMLSDICREHPRFYNNLGTHIEAGLGMVCEEAARLILTDESNGLEEIGVSDEAPADLIFDNSQYIARMYDILSENVPLEKRIRNLEEEFLIPMNMHSFGEWVLLFGELEILSSEWQDLMDKTEYKETTDALDIYFERFIKYMIYRHVSVSESYDNLRARLGFILVSELMVRQMIFSSSDMSLEGVINVMRLFSAEIEYSEDNTNALIFEFESAV